MHEQNDTEYYSGQKSIRTEDGKQQIVVGTIAYSIIQTALANNLNARDCLTQVSAVKGITQLHLEIE